MTDTEIIEHYKKQLESKTLFYIIDKRDEITIAVKEEVFHGYNGFVMDQDNSPIYIAKTYIQNGGDRFDFTTENPHRS